MLYPLDSRLVSDMLGFKEEKSPLISVAIARQIGVPVCQKNQCLTVRQICQNYFNGIASDKYLFDLYVNHRVNTFDNLTIDGLPVNY